MAMGNLAEIAARDLNMEHVAAKNDQSRGRPPS